MIEEFKNLEIDDVISFNDNHIIDFIESDDLMVNGIKIYSNDDAEMVIVELNDFFLVVHNFESEEKFFIYQMIDEGNTNELENNGYKFLNEEDDFRHKIVVKEDNKSYTYHPSDTGCVHGLTKEEIDIYSENPQEVSICEFFSASARLSNILIEREDNIAYIMQGFEITEDSFNIIKSE